MPHNLLRLIWKSGNPASREWRTVRWSLPTAARFTGRRPGSLDDLVKQVDGFITDHPVKLRSLVQPIPASVAY